MRLSSRVLAAAEKCEEGEQEAEDENEERAEKEEKEEKKEGAASTVSVRLWSFLFSLGDSERQYELRRTTESKGDAMASGPLHEVSPWEARTWSLSV